MKEEILLQLCVEMVKGDVASERFRELWIESGVALEGAEFEVANQLLVKAYEQGTEIPWRGRWMN